MLNDKTKNEWKLKVKSIFTEAQKKFTEDAETDELDLGGAEEDPDLQTPGNTEVDPVDDGAEEEQEPIITVTASLLKALLDYCSAPDEEDEVLPMDPSVEGDATSGNSSMIAAPPATSAGIMEDEEVSDEVLDGDDAEVVDGAEEVIDDSQVDADCEISADEIIQRLIDISAENGGEPLDVDVLNVVFSPESEEDADDLGDDELDGNVELPATTGDQTLPPTA